MRVEILMPVSRPDYLDRVFASLEFMDCDNNTTDLLVLVDGNNKLYDQAKQLVNASKFSQKRCIWRSDRTPVKQFALEYRRRRISKIHNEIKELCGLADFLFLIEDDGLLPTHALKRLQNDYALYPYAGFISGLCLGRHSISHIGAWEVDDVYNPSKVASITLGQGIKPVDAAGFYAMLVRKEHYTQHEFKPFEDVLGPDVEFGISLRKGGFTCYIDNDVRVEHLTPKGTITFANTEIVKAQLLKTEKGWQQPVLSLAH